MPLKTETNLLIIGAGPFGLSLAALASQLSIDHLIVGKPMEFWQNNMPKGMYLRSACDWHLDPLDIDTIESFLATQGKTSRDVEPLSLEFYLSYVVWFRKKKEINPSPIYVRRLDYDYLSKRFTATTFAEEQILAKRVVVAPGFKHFAYIPDELKKRLPARRFEHTSSFVDFSAAENKRYLIVGGRQSAYEWAALLLEAGAKAVHISHRHDRPVFKPSDWSWVNPLVDQMATNPSWFRQLSIAEKERIQERLWAEGRLKLEPWLGPRLMSDRVKVWPKTQVAEAVEQPGGDVLVQLTNGESFTVDQIVLATGYRVEISKLPLLANGNILGDLQRRNGFPVLDDHFQTSVPGLFITSMPATQDFGPFFGFTMAVRTSAKLICGACLQS